MSDRRLSAPVPVVDVVNVPLRQSGHLLRDFCKFFALAAGIIARRSNLSTEAVEAKSFGRLRLVFYTPVTHFMRITC